MSNINAPIIRRIESLVTRLNDARGEKPPEPSRYGPLKFDTTIVSILMIVHIATAITNVHLWIPAVPEQKFYEYSPFLWNINAGAIAAICFLRLLLATHYDSWPSEKNIHDATLFSIFAIATVKYAHIVGMMAIAFMSTMLCVGFFLEAWSRRLGESAEERTIKKTYLERQERVDQDPRTPIMERLERLMNSLRELNKISEADAFFDTFYPNGSDAEAEIEKLQSDENLGRIVGSLEESLKKTPIGEAPIVQDLDDLLDEIVSSGFISTAGEAAITSLQKAATSNRLRADRLRREIIEGRG